MMFPVVRMLMGIAVLVMEIGFVMVKLFCSFRSDAAIHLGQPSRSILQSEAKSLFGLVI